MKKQPATLANKYLDPCTLCGCGLNRVRCRNRYCSNNARYTGAGTRRKKPVKSQGYWFYNLGRR